MCRSHVSFRCNRCCSGFGSSGNVLHEWGIMESITTGDILIFVYLFRWNYWRFNIRKYFMLKNFQYLSIILKHYTTLFTSISVNCIVRLSLIAEKTYIVHFQWCRKAKKIIWKEFSPCGIQPWISKNFTLSISESLLLL